MKNCFTLMILLLLTVFTGCQNRYERLREINRPDKIIYLVESNSRKGVIDSNDSIIVPLEFEDVLDIPFGIMTYCGNGDYGLYDYQGKELFPCKYEGFYNPYGREDVVDVADSVTKTLYMVRSDAPWIKLLAYEQANYRVNDLRQPFFKSVGEGEILFCLYHITSDTYEKIYKLDKANTWTDVTSDAALKAEAEAYFNGDANAPEAEE